MEPSRSAPSAQSEPAPSQGVPRQELAEESRWVREVRRSAPEALEPLATDEGGGQRGLFEEAVPRQERPPTKERKDARHEQEPPVRTPEPVSVGTTRANAAVSVVEYLHDPGTPAIVRAGAVAETLGLPIDEVREAMAKAAGQSDGKITPIRADVYLVKRS